MIVGIDPGRSGGIAVLSDRVEYLFDMPVDEGEIDVLAIKTALSMLNIRICVIEKSQSFPGQGPVSMFNYGVGYGKLLAVLEMLEIGFHEVHPSVWKKELGVTAQRWATVRERKELSYRKAVLLYPELEKQLKTPKGKLLDGRVDALLIATYGKTLNKEVPNG